MTREKIFNIIQDNYSETIRASRKIYKLHLEDKISLLESVIKHPTKPGYKRHDILDKIKQLKKEFKELE